MCTMPVFVAYQSGAAGLRPLKPTLSGGGVHTRAEGRRVQECLMTEVEEEHLDRAGFEEAVDHRPGRIPIDGRSVDGHGLAIQPLDQEQADVFFPLHFA